MTHKIKCPNCLCNFEIKEVPDNRPNAPTIMEVIKSDKPLKFYKVKGWCPDYIDKMLGSVVETHNKKERTYGE